MDPTQAPPAPPGKPGHYGPGYGEVPPPGSKPDPDVALPPGAPRELPQTLPELPAGEPGQQARAVDDSARQPTERANRDGERVDFTAADVHARPPDRTPTESAPESEKVGLLFERG